MRISKLGCCRVLCQFQLTFHCINIFPSVWYPANNPIRNFPSVCVFLSLSTVHFNFSKYKLVAIHLLLLLCLNLLLSWLLLRWLCLGLQDISLRHWPPRQRMLFCYLVPQRSNGVHQGGQVYKMGHRLRVGGLRLRLDLNVILAVVQHGGTTDGVKRHGENGVVQLQLALGRSQVAHCHRLEVCELGASGRRNGGNGDVCQPDGTGRGCDIGVAKGHHHLRKNRKVTWLSNIWHWGKNNWVLIDSYVAAASKRSHTDRGEYKKLWMEQLPSTEVRR